MVAPGGGGGIGGAGGMPPELLNLALMEAAVRAVEKISEGVEKLTGKVKGAGDETRKQAKDANREAEERTKKAFGEIDRLFKAQKRNIQEAEGWWRKLNDEIRKQTEVTGGVASAWSKVVGPGGVGGAYSSLKSNLIGSAGGFGGIVGMMLWGAKREEEFAAAGRRAAYVMQQVGGIGQEQTRQLGRQARDLYNMWGSMGEELDAVLGSFAQFNIGRQAFQKASMDAGRFGKDIMSVSLAVDMLNNAQPGATAKMIGETMASSGVSIREASDQVFAMSKRLRELGLNYAQVGASIVQATSALRVQNQSLADTEKHYLKIRQAFVAGGMDPVKAASMAQTGLQALTGGLAGMQPGLQGFIAQRMAQRNVAGFQGINDPFAQMMALRTGAAGGGRVMTEMVTELNRIAKETVPDRGPGREKETELTRIGVLEKLGMPLEAAQAIIKMETDSAAIKDFGKDAKDYQRELRDAFKKRADTQSVFERDMRRANDIMARIGGSMLTMVVAGFRNIGNNLLALPLSFKSMFPSLLGGDLTKDEAEFLRLTNKANIQVFQSQDEVLQGVEQLFELLKANAARVTTDRLKTGQEETFNSLAALRVKMFSGSEIDLSAPAPEKHTPVRHRAKKLVPIGAGGGMFTPAEEPPPTAPKTVHKERVESGGKKFRVQITEEGTGLLPSAH